MPFLDRNNTDNSSSSNPQLPPLKNKQRPSWVHLWLKHQQSNNSCNGNNAVSASKMRRRRPSLSNSDATTPSEPDETLTLNPTAESAASDDASSPFDSVGGERDYTSLLSDELLTVVLSKLPESQCVAVSLSCQRWFRLSGLLVKSLRLLDWDFLDSGRLGYRFPNLTDVDLVRACTRSPRNSGILLTHKLVSVHVSPCFSDVGGGFGFIRQQDLLDCDPIDRGIRFLAEGCPNLRRLVLIGATEEGLSSISEECPTLQELELHCCTDLVLRGISRCRNLQILKLIGCVEGFYDSVISDIGLTIMAQGCRRLVKLELVGCEGSYDGIKAIGQCCQMLEELTLCDHRLDGGWLAALPFWENLKTLKLQSCKSIDSGPGPDEHLGSCRTLEELYLQRCQLRDKQGVRALFIVCDAVRDLVFEDCWGLDDIIFGAASICRRVRFLSLEGCSLLTMDAFDSVVLSFKELKRLRVVSCNSIKDSEITPDLAALFSVLKELKWRPDSRSLLSSELAGTGVGQKGTRSFRRN